MSVRPERILLLDEQILYTVLAMYKMLASYGESPGIVFALTRLFQCSNLCFFYTFSHPLDACVYVHAYMCAQPVCQRL